MSGWKESASAWIADMGGHGDYGRQFVLDPPMIARVEGRGFRRALDVGCGEGRFCRMLKTRGVEPVGIDPTEALIEQARRRDPEGDYRLGCAEALEFPDASFDLIVSYLTLIDIAEVETAISEMTRVLRPGGTLLIANLTSFSTAGGWTKDEDGGERFVIDRYLEERAEWAAWRGIRIRSWHRPLSTYMSLLLDQGMQLCHFSEPAPVGGDPRKADRYRRVPHFMMMEWTRPMDRAAQPK